MENFIYGQLGRQDVLHGFGTQSVILPNGSTATIDKIGLHTWSSWRNVSDFGAVGDGSTDDTVAIQAAIDNLYVTDQTGGVVFFPVGNFLISQIEIPPGISILGCGIGPSSLYTGTFITQKTGVNVSAIVSSTEFLSTDHLHWVMFKDFYLKKAAGVDSVGDGIEINMRTGQGFTIDNVQVEGFPEAGVQFNNGGTDLLVRRLACHTNGTYGLDVKKTGVDTWHSVEINNVSGDNNLHALIRIKSAGGTNTDSFEIDTIKSECRIPGRQLFTVELDDLNAAPVTIRNMVSLGSGTPGTAAVRIKTAIARVKLEMCRQVNFGNLIQDDFASVNVAYSTADMDLIYYAGVVAWRATTGGATSGVVDISPTALTLSPTTSTVPFDILRTTSGYMHRLRRSTSVWDFYILDTSLKLSAFYDVTNNREMMQVDATGKRIQVRRIQGNLGSALVSGDFALHANWGASASIAVGGTDQCANCTLTAAGAGAGANPTVILTFKDGTWTDAPKVLVGRNGGDQASVPFTWSVSATQLTMTFVGTPIAGQVFNFTFICL